MQKLVLDLRGNGGGYLNAATELASEFLEKGKLIVYTKGVHEPGADYFATDSGLFQHGKLAVLIDEYSASASEILAGALQDFDRAYCGPPFIWKGPGAAAIWFWRWFGR